MQGVVAVQTLEASADLIDFPSRAHPQVLPAVAGATGGRSYMDAREVSTHLGVRNLLLVNAARLHWYLARPGAMSLPTGNGPDGPEGGIAPPAVSPARSSLIFQER
jgi:hypothetical protein